MVGCRAETDPGDYVFVPCKVGFAVLAAYDLVRVQIDVILEAHRVWAARERTAVFDGLLTLSQVAEVSVDSGVGGETAGKLG